MGTSSSDDFESGTIAALHGGTTSIIDFAIQVRVKVLTLPSISGWKKLKERRALIMVSP